ncbi:MAG: anti-sigma factor family protein [Vulcanimicrobiaceae bacterium]
MRCSSCESLLDLYVEGSLAPKDVRAVDAHVRDCKPCAALLAEIRVVDALLATARPAQLAPNFTFAVMAEVRSLPAPRRTGAPLAAILGGYVLAAWLLLSAVAVAFAGRLPALAAFQSTEWQGVLQALRAVAGAGAPIAPAMPAILTAVAGLLIVDAAFLTCIVIFYRNVRPRLAAHLARSEAS